MYRTMIGKEVTALKDDGCNTDVLSKTFADRHRRLLNIQKASFTINHSNKDSAEVDNELVLGTKFQLEDHVYRSNWVVANCQYDVMLGMPWHVKCKPAVNYDTGKPKAGNITLPSSRDSNKCINVQNLGVMKFRSFLRKKKNNNENFVVYQVRYVNNTMVESKSTVEDPEDEKLLELKREWQTVFTDELPDGLPPERDVDHRIKTEAGSSLPNRGIFQLSPVELIATKEYMMELLRKGKICPSKSPYGAPLFFMKQKKQIRDIIDNRALNRITKHNNASILQTDEVFDRLGGTQFFSKLDLKAGFHQIRIAPQDIEKTAFKTKYGHFEFLVMPMGLRNTSATFQALMNAIFRGCIDEYSVIYLDDILVSSNTREKHLNHLRIVLSSLKEHELFVGKKKI